MINIYNLLDWLWNATPIGALQAPAKWQSHRPASQLSIAAFASQASEAQGHTQRMAWKGIHCPWRKSGWSLEDLGNRKLCTVGGVQVEGWTDLHSVWFICLCHDLCMHCCLCSFQVLVPELITEPVWWVVWWFVKRNDRSFRYRRRS